MRNRFAALVVLALCAPLLSAAQPAAPTPDLAPPHLVAKAAAAGRVHVIVELGGAAVAPERLLPHAAAIAGQRQLIGQAQADVRRALRGLAHRVHREYTSMPYMAIEVGPDALRMLGAMRGLVTRVDEDLKLSPMLGESGPLVQAPTAWAAGFDGQGTVIAVIDTGVDKSHPFLQGKVIDEACFVRGAVGPAGDCPNGLDSQVGPGSGLPCAGCTHGTHVAGIAAGDGAAPANVGFSGIGKGADLMSIRVFAASGGSSLADVLAALEHVYLRRGTHNFAAVNMSLGVANLPLFSTCDAFDPATTTVIGNLRAAGIATVVSSGNDHFTSAISFPACIGAAISVASNDDGSFGTTANRVSAFSNVAPFVSLIAPGKWITSSFPGNLYQTISGTSMAAPHVAGAFAVLRQALPGATVTQVLDVLRTTGRATTDSASVERPGAVGTVMSQIRLGDALGTLSTVQFASASFTVTEAGTALITVTRAGSTTGTATVNYATTDGTAIGGTHYTPASGMLTFNPGEVSQTFTVAPIDNTVFNADRTLGLRLSSPTGALRGVPSKAVLTITNDDSGGAIGFGAAAYTVAENGGAAVIEVVRAGTSLAGGVTVHFATADKSALAGTAYTATSGTLTFAPGVTSLTFSVPILDNSLLQGDKTFQVKLSGATGGGVLGSRTTTLVTIVEDDTAGTVQFSSPTYTVGEGARAATVTVTRTGVNLAGGIRVGYAASNGSAVAGSDYTATSGTLTFGAGVTSRSFLVPIINDAIQEPDETIQLRLTVPAGSPAMLGAPATAVLTIEANDPPTIRFALAAQTVTEGSTAKVVVTRVRGLGAPATVDYEVTAGGTATPGGGDYTLPQTGTLTFAANQTSVSIPVATTPDTHVEGPETITLRLLNPTGGAGAVLGAQATTTLTIVDNDNPGTVQFSAAAYRVAENAGAIDLIVTRTGIKLASDITVDYTVVGGTATNGVGVGADYTLANGTLTFAAGQTSLPIHVVINDDPDHEGNETVIVALSNTIAKLGPIHTTTLTILDDEETITFSSAVYSGSEGVTSIGIPILRAGPTPAGTTVTCKTILGGSANAGVDYLAVDTTLTFAAGSRMVTCPVPILNNTIVDGPRTVNLELVSPSPSPGLLGMPSTAVLTLNDNDQGGTIRFGAPAFVVAEGATASLTVLRTGVNLASGVTVDYAVTGGSALGTGVDFTLASGTLSFGAGQAVATISVPTVNDTLVEGPETVIVALSNPTGGAALGTPAATSLTITDNDHPGTVQFSAATYRVAENVATGSFDLIVTRTGTNLASDITVDYAVVGGTAINGVGVGADYTLANGTLTFAAGVTSLPIRVLINDDPDAEGNETVIVALSSATATLGPIHTTTLTILDDEVAITFSSPVYTATEGTPSIAIPILRAGLTAPGGTTVTCQTVGGSAVPGLDYRAVNTTLTFAPGSRMVTCLVPILDDTLVDGAKTVDLALSIPVGSPGMLGLHPTAVLTLDDDDHGGTIRFASATFTVAEGATVPLTVVRSGVKLASGVTVDYAVTGGTATAGADFKPIGGTLTFKAGQTSVAIPVSALADLVVDKGETIVVTLSNPTSGAALGSPASTTVTIQDVRP